MLPAKGVVMQINRYNLFIGAGLLSTLALFAGCKSKSAVLSPTNQKPTTINIPSAINTAEIANARELLNLAVENSLKTKSVVSAIQMNIEMMGMLMPLTFDISKNEQTTYTKGSFMGMRFEVYADGKNMVMLDPMQGKWMRVPDEQKDMILSLDKMQARMYGEHIKDASFAGEEKIQDTMCRIIDAIVKPESFSEMLAGQNNPIMQDMEIKFDQASLKIWVAKDTGLISKTILKMEATLTGDLMGHLDDSEDGYDIEDEEESPEIKTPAEKKPETPKTSKIKYEIEIDNSDYNRVAPIVIPPKVKALLEGSAVMDSNNE
jgi:hypothetical protein